MLSVYANALPLTNRLANPTTPENVRSTCSIHDLIPSLHLASFPTPAALSTLHRPEHDAASAATASKDPLARQLNGCFVGGLEKAGSLVPAV